MDNVTAQAKAARGMLVSQLETRGRDLGETLSQHAGNLHDMSETLRNQGQDPTARMVDYAATKLEDISTYMRETDGARMIHDLESVARKNALITGAIGLVGGITIARLLKASASKRYRDYGSGVETPFQASASNSGESYSA